MKQISLLFKPDKLAISCSKEGRKRTISDSKDQQNIAQTETKQPADVLAWLLHLLTIPPTSVRFHVYAEFMLKAREKHSAHKTNTAVDQLTN